VSEWVVDGLDAVRDVALAALLGLDDVADATDEQLALWPVRYVHSSTNFAWDCAGLYLYSDRVYPAGRGTAPDGRGAQQKAVMPAANLNCLVLWCITDKKRVPTPAEVTAQTRDMLDACALVTSALMRGVTSGTLLGSCRSVTFTQAAPVGPQGGFAGWQFQLLATR
jgi:hypothetical protein